MFNVSEYATIITGWDGKPGALGQAAWDKKLSRNLKYDYKGSRVRRGTCEMLLDGEWRTVRFDVDRGWARKLEVL